MDLSLGFEGTHVVVTGAAGHIGKVVVLAFLSAGSLVTAFDINESEMTMVHDRLHWEILDITDESKVQTAFETAAEQRGVISTCIALAGADLSYLEHHHSVTEMTLEQWRRTNQVNAEGTFLTARAWLRGIKARATTETRNVSLVIIGSEAGIFGVSGNADYSSSKAAIQYGLVKSMIQDVVRIHPRARVNAIAPGAVHTPQFDIESAADTDALYVEAQATVAMKTPVTMESVAKACLFLASESWSGSITGQLIQIDSGKSGRLYWEREENAKR